MENSTWVIADVRSGHCARPVVERNSGSSDRGDLMARLIIKKLLGTRNVYRLKLPWRGRREETEVLLELKLVMRRKFVSLPTTHKKPQHVIPIEGAPIAAQYAYTTDTGIGILNGADLQTMDIPTAEYQARIVYTDHTIYPRVLTFSDWHVRTHEGNGVVEEPVTRSSYWPQRICRDCLLLHDCDRGTRLHELVEGRISKQFKEFGPKPGLLGLVPFLIPLASRTNLAVFHDTVAVVDFRDDYSGASDWIYRVGSRQDHRYNLGDYMSGCKAACRAYLRNISSINCVEQGVITKQSYQGLLSDELVSISAFSDVTPIVVLEGSESALTQLYDVRRQATLAEFFVGTHLISPLYIGGMPQLIRFREGHPLEITV